MKIFAYLTSTLLALFFGLSPLHAESGNSAILGTASFDNGGFALGADYEYKYHNTFGIGGYVRLYQKDDETSDGNATQPGVTAFGAFIRPHFNRRMWDLSVAPGFGVVNYDPLTDGDAEMGFGPALMINLLYQVNRQMALGIELIKINTWFNDKIPTNSKEDIAIKLRFAF